MRSAWCVVRRAQAWGGFITPSTVFLGTLLILLGSMLLPVATAHFVAQDKLSAAFRFGEWWPLLKANKLGYFMAQVVVLGLITLLYLVFTLAYYTLILLCFLPFLVAPLSFYLMLIASALFGQTCRESREMVGAQGLGIGDDETTILTRAFHLGLDLLYWQAVEQTFVGQTLSRDRLWRF